MSYVDGFVIPVPKRKLAAYRKMAQMGKRLWMKAETVFFSFIVFRNKAHRDAVNKKVIAGMSGPPPDMPFDTRRMAYGGFKTLVEAKA